MPRQLRPTVSACSALALLAGFAIGSSAAPVTSAKVEKVEGVLIDQHCSARAETRMVPDPTPHLEGGILSAYIHPKSCLLLPECRRSGYGVFTNDTNEFLLFDPTGNQKALALIEASKKDDDMRVEVTGEIEGNKIKVASLKFLP
ncbi:MAG: hypothetical protein ABI833_17590 [Acidobacteriota bacterium]